MGFGFSLYQICDHGPPFLVSSACTRNGNGAEVLPLAHKATIQLFGHVLRSGDEPAIHDRVEALLDETYDQFSGFGDFGIVLCLQGVGTSSELPEATAVAVFEIS